MLPRKNLLLVFKRSLLLISVFFLIVSFVFILNLMNPSKQIQLSTENFTISKLSEPKTQPSDTSLTDVKIPVNSNVHIFYYPWYGNPETDDNWLHWNHQYLPNWDKNDRKIYPTGRHIPPDDIGANFYPSLGCYSSRDPNTIDQHMIWIREAGIGVLVISWYPPEEADREGEPFDSIFPLLLDRANFFGLKIAFHIEPYKDRNPENLRKNLKYIVEKYGKHPALYRRAKNMFSPTLPVYYIYDSYLNTAKSWTQLLSPSGSISVRKTELDGIFIGLVVEPRHKQDIKDAGFDGFYTYFAASDFTYGSSWKNWKSLSSFAHKNGLLFVPSLGPGYVDTRVRPWNSKTIRSRKNGQYYTFAWRTATLSRPDIVSITSFNEWHEGTQIEPAQPKISDNYTYEDYSPQNPDFYLKLTKQFVDEFSNH